MARGSNGSIRAMSSKSGGSGGPSPSTTKVGEEAGASRGPVTFLSLGVLALAAGGVLFYYNIEKEKRSEQVASKVTTTGKAALGGPWVLVDENGIPRTDASFKGQYTLLYFGFSYCPDICPSELVKIGKVLQKLKSMDVSRESHVKPLFISVDPTRDTVGQLKFYSQDFDKDFSYLTGTKEQIAAASKAYRVYFSKANENENDEEDYLVDHSIVFYLVNPKGEFLDFFTQRMKADDIVEKIKEHIKAKN
jgi:protein SCO1/2